MLIAVILGFKKYERNSFLRLYPGLWFFLLTTIVPLLCFHTIDFVVITSFPFICWMACQLKFFQFYTPDFLINWGVGTPNGSLWTISVEVQFYIFLPFYIYLYMKLSKKVFITVSLLLFFLRSLLSNCCRTWVIKCLRASCFT